MINRQIQGSLQVSYGAVTRGSGEMIGWISSGYPQ